MDTIAKDPTLFRTAVHFIPLVLLLAIAAPHIAWAHEEEVAPNASYETVQTTSVQTNDRAPGINKMYLEAIDVNKRLSPINLESNMEYLTDEAEDSDEAFFEDANSKEAINYVLGQMQEREHEITVRFRCESGFILNRLAEELFDNALEHTGQANAGDYISHQIGSWNYDCSLEEDGDDYLIANVTYTVDYFTTTEQERRVEQKIEQISDELDLSNLGEYERTCAIYKYITSHVKYDYTNLDNDKYTLKYTAYAALFNGQAVCQGYAVLFYRLANECGLSSRIISGLSNPEKEEHAWNIVRIDGKYYNVDCTWDAGKEPSCYDYFLKCDASFRDHHRDTEYSSEDFYEKHPMAKLDYLTSTSLFDAAITGLSSKPYTSKPLKPIPIVKLCGRVLEPGIDYGLSYANNVNVGTATITITGKGIFTGKLTKSFKIVQATNKAKTKKNRVRKAFEAEALKKKAGSISLPKVTTKFGKPKWKITKKDAEKALSLKNGRIKVKKGTRKGTYAIKLKAAVAATRNYKAASTKVVTITVTVK